MMILRQGGFLIAKIHQISGRIFSKLLKKHQIDFNPAQGRILFVLWQNDDIPIHELVKRTQLSKSTLTSMIDRLEKAGHVKRIHSDDDRRTILIKLTDKNRSLQNKYVQVSNEMNELFYNGFAPSEIDDFENYLKRILVNLKERRGSN